ncbi:hypothetical protein IFM89_020794 [Coptis chinensis]|uniref:Uncharacterized protein n=1 Tax=Coptis chinensis TaxID=261450 RepID=A0A835HS08_9MAGN|nr:hypothetical protein IFM89_020794 [Coptis chinensis]
MIWRGAACSIDSRLAPQWYRMEDRRGDKSKGGEVMASIWFGTQADEAFAEAWHSKAASVHLDSLCSIKSKLWKPHVGVLEMGVLGATGLMPMKIKEGKGSQPMHLALQKEQGDKELGMEYIVEIVSCCSNNEGEMLSCYDARDSSHTGTEVRRSEPCNNGGVSESFRQKENLQFVQSSSEIGYADRRSESSLGAMRAPTGKSPRSGMSPPRIRDARDTWGNERASTGDNPVEPAEWDEPSTDQRC